MKSMIQKICAWFRARWEERTGTFYLREQLKTALEENAQLKVLLSTAALRSAPKKLSEIFGGSNLQTGNVCYIHPKVMSQFGLVGYIGIFRVGPALILSTELMPEFGVIYAPLSRAFFTPEQIALFEFDGWRTTLPPLRADLHG